MNANSNKARASVFINVLFLTAMYQLSNFQQILTKTLGFFN